MQLFCVIIISAIVFAVCVLLYSLRAIKAASIEASKEKEEKSFDIEFPIDIEIKPKSGKEYSGDGKNDERALEVGEVETTFVSIEDETKKYQESLSDKQKQDAAAEMLLKVVEKNNEQQQAVQKVHKEAHEEAQKQIQKKQFDRQQKNKKQLEKLRGTKVEKKVKKKLEKNADKKNTEITDKDIKKIKLQKNAGKMK